MESSSLNSGQSEVDKRPLVLAVDDNYDNLELLTQILDLFGCECMGAVDGYAALSAAVARPPDLIVLDICLPDIDGIEVVKRIQENAEPQTYSDCGGHSTSKSRRPRADSQSRLR